MTAGWVRHEPVTTLGVQRSETATGDTWDTRWSRPFADGIHAVVTRSFFPMQFADENGPEGDPYLYQIDDYIACTNPADPVETELWSDARHAGVIDGEPTAKAAHDAAMAAEVPTDTEWDRVAPDAWSLDARRRESTAEHAAVMWKAQADYDARRRQRVDEERRTDTDEDVA